MRYHFNINLVLLLTIGHRLNDYSYTYWEQYARQTNRQLIKQLNGYKLR